MRIMVTIMTTAYNHAEYIAQTLDSILSQKTDFPFEILVHDDASTDGTAEIIRDYAERYPDIVRPILQTENQYSKGVDIYGLMAPFVRGKYTAQCEGDDYWCDDNKLQMQVDFLENHPDYVACVHDTLQINLRNLKKTQINGSETDYDVPFSQVVTRGSAAFHTSSVVVRTPICCVLYQGQMPKYFEKIGVGDYPFAIYLATCGKVRYLGRTMSVYRKFSPHSWSIYQLNKIKLRKDHTLQIINMLYLLDDETEGKYTKEIEPVLVRQYQNLLSYYPIGLRFKTAVSRTYRLTILLLRTEAGRFKRFVLRLVKRNKSGE